MTIFRIQNLLYPSPLKKKDNLTENGRPEETVNP